eukprot:5958320-Amphidinium_carterae.1
MEPMKRTYKLSLASNYLKLDTCLPGSVSVSRADKVVTTVATGESCAWAFSRDNSSVSSQESYARPTSNLLWRGTMYRFFSDLRLVFDLQRSSHAICQNNCNCDGKYFTCNLKTNKV